MDSFSKHILLFCTTKITEWELLNHINGTSKKSLNICVLWRLFFLLHNINKKLSIFFSHFLHVSPSEFVFNIEGIFSPLFCFYTAKNNNYQKKKGNVFNDFFCCLLWCLHLYVNQHLKVIWRLFLTPTNIIIINCSNCRTVHSKFMLAQVH